MKQQVILTCTAVIGGNGAIVGGYTTGGIVGETATTASFPIDKTETLLMSV